MIRKGMVLVWVGTSWMCATSIDLGTIDVEAKADTQIIKDVNGVDIKSADLGEALFKQSPSVSLIRRSAVANDIRIRGQKKDNINVTIDGAKVYGACPNRMDPPISHILTNNVDFIEINEGPYNVEDFGVLSADIKVHTLKPKEKFEGELNADVGNFAYQKGAFSLRGGTQKVRLLLSGSIETANQYKDGNGDDFVGQIGREIVAGAVPKATQYQSQYQNKDAYTKKTLMAKMFWDITKNQRLKLSYTANRSDNVLYPSSKMDALYDNSDIYNLEYIVNNLGRYSKELNVQVYESDVAHPMSTKYRKMGAITYVTHSLSTKMQGAKVKNNFDVKNHTIATGVDYSLRNWDGGYFKNDVPFPTTRFHSIWDVDTKNIAFFLKDKISLNKIDIDLGLRYDSTEITSANPTQASNDYDALSAYIFGTYLADENTKYFAGFGKSSRVPDGKELYWIGSMGNAVGTPNLEQTTNYEFDMGVEKQFEDASLKAKLFYSKLENYIAYNASDVNDNGTAFHAYENVNAKLYGFELSGTYIVTESLYFDYGVAYQRGKKDTPLEGQIGTNMPDIAPLKANVALNYDYDESLNLRAEVVAASAWNDFDAENGEQKLDAYGVLNLKGIKQFGKNFELTVGVDNLFDKTYAVSNTYKDLVLLPTVGNNEVMLLNEPGRYVYTNLKYMF